MAAKIIDELKIAYMSFHTSYAVIMELDTKRVKEENLGSEMVAETERKRSL